MNLAEQARANAKRPRLQSGPREQYLPAGFHDYGTVMFETTIDMMSPDCAQVMGMANDDEYAAVIINKRTASPKLLSEKPVFVESATQKFRQLVKKVASDGDVEIYKWKEVDFSRVFKYVEMGTFIRQSDGNVKYRNETATLRTLEESSVENGTDCSLITSGSLVGKCKAYVRWQWDEEENRPKKIPLTDGDSYAQIGFNTEVSVSLEAKLGGGGFSMIASADLNAAAGVGFGLSTLKSASSWTLLEKDIEIPLPWPTSVEILGYTIGFKLYINGAAEIRDVELTLPEPIRYYRGLEFSYGVSAEFGSALDGYSRIKKNGPTLTAISENTIPDEYEIEDATLAITPVIALKFVPALHMGKSAFRPYVGAELGADMKYSINKQQCRFPYLTGTSQFFVQLVYDTKANELLEFVLRGLLGSLYDVISEMIAVIVEGISRFLEQLANSSWIVRKLLVGFTAKAKKLEEMMGPNAIECWRQKEPFSGCLFGENAREGLADLKESAYVPAVLMMPTNVKTASDLSKGARIWDVQIEWQNGKLPNEHAFTWKSDANQPQLAVFRTNVAREYAWRYHATEIRWGFDSQFNVPHDGSFRSVTDTDGNTRSYYGEYDDSNLEITTKQLLGSTVGVGKEFEIKSDREHANKIRMRFNWCWLNYPVLSFNDAFQARIYRATTTGDWELVGTFNSGKTLEKRIDYYASTDPEWQAWCLDIDLGANFEYHWIKIECQRNDFKWSRSWGKGSGWMSDQILNVEGSEEGFTGSEVGKARFETSVTPTDDSPIFYTLDGTRADTEYMLIQSASDGAHVIRDSRVLGFDSSICTKSEIERGAAGYRRRNPVRLTFTRVYCNVQGSRDPHVVRGDISKCDKNRQNCVTVGAFTTGNIEYEKWKTAADLKLTDWGVEFDMDQTCDCQMKIHWELRDKGLWDSHEAGSDVFFQAKQSWTTGQEIVIETPGFTDDPGSWWEISPTRARIEFKIAKAEPTIGMLVDQTLAGNRGIIAPVVDKRDVRFTDDQTYGILRVVWYTNPVVLQRDRNVVANVEMENAVPLERHEILSSGDTTNLYLIYTTLGELVMHDDDPNRESDRSYCWLYIPYRKISPEKEVWIQVYQCFNYPSSGAICSIASSTSDLWPYYFMNDPGVPWQWSLGVGCGFREGNNWKGTFGNGDKSCGVSPYHTIECQWRVADKTVFDQMEKVPERMRLVDTEFRVDQMITLLPDERISAIKEVYDKTVTIIKTVDTLDEEWGQLYLSTGAAIDGVVDGSTITYRHVLSDEANLAYTVGLCKDRSKKGCVVVDDSLQSEDPNSLFLAEFGFSDEQFGVTDQERWFGGENRLKDNVRFQIVRGGTTYHYSKDWIGEVTYKKLQPGDLVVTYSPHVEDEVKIVDVTVELAGVMIPFSVSFAGANADAIFQSFGYSQGPVSTYAKLNEESTEDDFYVYSSNGTIMITSDHFNYNVEAGDWDNSFVDLDASYIQSIVKKCSSDYVIQNGRCVTPSEITTEESSSTSSEASSSTSSEASSSTSSEASSSTSSEASSSSSSEESSSSGGSSGDSGKTEETTTPVGVIVGSVIGAVVMVGVVIFSVLYKLKKLTCFKKNERTETSTSLQEDLLNYAS